MFLFAKLTTRTDLKELQLLVFNELLILTCLSNHLYKKTLSLYFYSFLANDVRDWGYEKKWQNETCKMGGQKVLFCE